MSVERGWIGDPQPPREAYARLGQDWRSSLRPLLPAGGSRASLEGQDFTLAT